MLTSAAPLAAQPAVRRARRGSDTQVQGFYRGLQVHRHNLV